MTMTHRLAILLLLTIVSGNYAMANPKESQRSSNSEKAIIFIEAEIYKYDRANKLKNEQNALKKTSPIKAVLAHATLEESPKLMIEQGKDATIEIGIQDDTGNDVDMIRLHIISDETTDTYTIAFQLISEGDERLSQIEDVQLNSKITLSSSINNVDRIAIINARKFANYALADAARLAASTKK